MLENQYEIFNFREVLLPSNYTRMHSFFII